MYHKNGITKAQVEQARAIQAAADREAHRKHLEEAAQTIKEFLRAKKEAKPAEVLPEAVKVEAVPATPEAVEPDQYETTWQLENGHPIHVSVPRPIERAGPTVITVDTSKIDPLKAFRGEPIEQEPPTVVKVEPEPVKQRGDPKGVYFPNRPATAAQPNASMANIHIEAYADPRLKKSVVYDIAGAYWISQYEGKVYLLRRNSNEFYSSDPLPVELRNNGGIADGTSVLWKVRLDKSEPLTKAQYDEILSAKPSLEALTKRYAMYHNDEVLLDTSNPVTLF